MKISILSREKKTEIINGKEAKNVLFGSSLDSSNATVDTTVLEWDSTKTDYAIEDIVYVAGWYFEYVCLQDGNRENPLISKFWKKSKTLAQYRYRDNSTRYSYTDVDVPFVAYLHPKMGENHFFVHGMMDVKHLLVEGIADDGNVAETIIDRDTIELVSFRMYACCSLVHNARTVLSNTFGGCGRYSKIRVTLTPFLGKIPKVGSMGVGKAWKLGCLSEYPSFDDKSLSKYERQDVDLELIEKVGYADVKVKFNSDRGLENNIDRLLRENKGKYVFVIVDEFEKKDEASFLGFYREVPKSPKQSHQEISMQFFGVPTIPN